jgi:protein-S-isoprenylcysteine O-methyltransferase Ste14
MGWMKEALRAGRWAGRVAGVPQFDSNRSFRERGGWWVVGQSILMLGAVVLGVSHGGGWVSLGGFILGWVLFVVGGVAGVWGVIQLGEARTAFPRPLGGGARLVTTGVYRWVRHPLYFSVVTSLLGWGLIWASWTSLAACLVLGLFLDAKARREERWLAEVYPEYGAYSRRVKRLFPGIY